MIIKGGSRAAATWLGNHLARTDHNERAEVLELQSLHDGAQPMRESLIETFRDWQALAGGTRGENGLYHANIDPAAIYEMTPVQWARAVDVLERELGLEGQPRAVVLHEKEGRQHIHVVWARTDIETMTLRDDGFNYAAHERASQQLEHEFGHEAVPGKHAKRDRDLQPEPPKSKFTHAEWQQAERAGLHPREHKAALATLMAQSDNGQAFKAAIEEAGYVLTRGDRRDFVAVDTGGGTHSLGRINDMKKPEIAAFMADVDRDSLPNVEEGRALQAARPRQAPPAKSDSGASGAAEPAGSAVAEPVTAPAPETRAEARLRAALAERHRQERDALEQRQAGEIARHEEESRAAADAAARVKTGDAAEPEVSGMALILRQIREFLNPDLQHARERAEDDRRFAREADEERARNAALAHAEREAAVERRYIGGRHDDERRALEASQAAELERRLQEERRAQEIARELEQQRQTRLSEGEGPERGPPRAR